MKRTQCDCKLCQVGCTTMPGMLIPDDLERIAAHCEAEDNPQWIADHFCSSEGTRVIEQTAPDRVDIVQIGTITPQLEAGRCVFLDENNRCRIHAVAPFGCAYVDTHMNLDEVRERSMHGLSLIRGDDAYQRVRSTLPASTSAADRRTAYRDSFLQALAAES